MHRLAVATTGTDLLDKKRRALVQEHRRLRFVARETAAEWSTAAAEAQRWVERAAILAGEEKLALLAAVHPRAEVSLRWRSSMGVPFVAEARVDFGPDATSTSSGSAAGDLAVPAARAALDAAVRDAAAQSALKRIGAELAVTTRRQRALERRWLPALIGALVRVNGRLDEVEIEEATRSLWIRRRAQQRRT